MACWIGRRTFVSKINLPFLLRFLSCASLNQAIKQSVSTNYMTVCWRRGCATITTLANLERKKMTANAITISTFVSWMTFKHLVRGCPRRTRGSSASGASTHLFVLNGLKNKGQGLSFLLVARWLPYTLTPLKWSRNSQSDLRTNMLYGLSKSCALS